MLLYIKKKKKFKRTLFQYNFTVSSESFKNTDWLFDFERQDDTKWDASTDEGDAVLP